MSQCRPSTEFPVVYTSSIVYIGQTGRTLEHRLKEHRRALSSGNTAQSVVAEHAVDQMHVIDWNEAQVMACHPYHHQKCALEAWHIRTECQKMNRDAVPLPSVYDPLIHQSCPYTDCAIAIFIHYYPTDISTYFLVIIISAWCTHIVSIISITLHYIIYSCPPHHLPLIPAVYVYIITLPVV